MRNFLLQQIADEDAATYTQHIPSTSEMKVPLRLSSRNRIVLTMNMSAITCLYKNTCKSQIRILQRKLHKKQDAWSYVKKVYFHFIIFTNTLKHLNDSLKQIVKYTKSSYFHSLIFSLWNVFSQKKQGINGSQENLQSRQENKHIRMVERSD